MAPKIATTKNPIQNRTKKFNLGLGISKLTGKSSFHRVLTTFAQQGFQKKTAPFLANGYG